MIGTKTIDPGMDVDWGKTSEDYAKYRPGPPPSFYEKLKALEVGLQGQRILDVGTGTGVIARQLASQGCDVIGTDISNEQIEMAKSLAKLQNQNIEFIATCSEKLDFQENSFDVIIANQCFLYFDVEVIKPLFSKFLKEDGVLVLSHFSWMPFLDPIAKASEELILKHNPNWTAHSYKGDIKPSYPQLESHFKYKGFFFYDEGIAFTKDTWLGRIRASRGISASLDSKAVEVFNNEHSAILDKLLDENNFEIIHRLDAHVLCKI